MTTSERTVWWPTEQAMLEVISGWNVDAFEGSSSTTCGALEEKKLRRLNLDLNSITEARNTGMQVE